MNMETKETLLAQHRALMAAAKLALNALSEEKAAYEEPLQHVEDAIAALLPLVGPQAAAMPAAEPVIDGYPLSQGIPQAEPAGEIAELEACLTDDAALVREQYPEVAENMDKAADALTSLSAQLAQARTEKRPCHFEMGSADPNADLRPACGVYFEGMEARNREIQSQAACIAELEGAVALCGKRIASLSAQLELLATDKSVVRANLLRGTLARPDDVIFMHDTHGPFAEQSARIASLSAQLLHAQDQARLSERLFQDANVETAEKTARIASLEAENARTRELLGDVCEKVGRGEILGPQFIYEIKVAIEERKP